jgi:hypothetical protein
LCRYSPARRLASGPAPSPTCCGRTSSRRATTPRRRLWWRRNLQKKEIEKNSVSSRLCSSFSRCSFPPLFLFPPAPALALVVFFSFSHKKKGNIIVCGANVVAFFLSITAKLYIAEMIVQEQKNKKTWERSNSARGVARKTHTLIKISEERRNVCVPYLITVFDLNIKRIHRMQRS